MSQRVYVVHGWTYNLDKWQPIVPLLQKAGIELTFLKVPGLTAPSDKVWNIDDYVEWLKGELKNEKQPIVIGHSNGGRIALRFENTYPGRIKKLILIDAAGVPHEQASSRLKLSVLKVISKLGKPLKHIPLVKKAFYRLIGAQDYLQAPSNMKKTMQNMLDANELIKFDKVSVPTTLIWGAHDQQTPLSDGKFMEQHIPDATLHTINGSRHAPMFTHSEEVAKLIVEAVK
jgi:pimeloyl-ACP methyl ester carboxylesterase